MNPNMRYALGAMLVYLALCLPSLAMHHFDISNFIIAGDRLTDHAQTPTAIMVRHNSDGYDGQFYYRMAVRPWSLAPRFAGVQFDKPAYRMRRIAYPALAWAASCGHANWVPAALFAVNLAALGAVAYLALLLCAEQGFSPLVALGVIAWPGFIISLTHDTAEIVTVMLVLAALLARLRHRALVYSVLALAAMLARETSLVIFAGLWMYDATVTLHRRGKWHFAVAGFVAMALAIGWIGGLSLLWAGATNLPVGRVLGLPLLGAFENLHDAILGARHWASTPAKDAALRVIVVMTSSAIIGFCAVVASKLPTAWRRVPDYSVAWGCAAAFMSLLTADGPWIDPAAYGRAFSECYALGCLVLGAAGWRWRWRASLALGGVMFTAIWVLCLVQLRVQ